MVKWYCLGVSRSSDPASRVKKNYMPRELKHSASNRSPSENLDAFMARSEVGVTVISATSELLGSGGVGRVGESGTTFRYYYYVYGLLPRKWTMFFDNARKAFEAAEKVFASNYPESYLQAVMNESGKSRD